MNVADPEKHISYAPYIWQSIGALVGAAIDLWKSDVIQSLLTSKTLGYVGDFDTECTTASETIFANIGMGFALIIMVYGFNKLISLNRHHTWRIFVGALLLFIGLTGAGQFYLKNNYAVAKDMYALECPDTRVEGTGQANVIMPENPAGELKQLIETFNSSPGPGEDNICARDGAMGLMTLIHNQENNRTGATRMCTNLKVRYLTYTMVSQFALALILAFVIGTIIFVARDIYDEAKSAGKAAANFAIEVIYPKNNTPPVTPPEPPPPEVNKLWAFLLNIFKPVITVITKLIK